MQGSYKIAVYYSNNNFQVISHFGISTLNAVSYDGPTTVATATPIALPQTVQTSIPNTGGTYIVRVFSAADNCYLDETIVVAEVICCPTTTNEICPGESYTLDAGPGLLNIQWFKDNVAIAGATAQTYVATMVGSYHFTANMAATGCAASGCCPIVLVVGTCPTVCPPNLCFPVSVVRN